MHKQQKPAPNWQSLDLGRDSICGISTEKAYTELLKGKTPKQVIVAVIDAGVDTNHEDLKAILWHNSHKKDFDNGTYGWSSPWALPKVTCNMTTWNLTRQVRQFESADTSKLLNSSSADDLPRRKKKLSAKLKSDARQALA